MLYELLYPLRDAFFAFNVFRYISFRAMFASITAFLLTVWAGPMVVRFLADLNLKQTIKREGFSALYGAHEKKERVPTMGGVLILGSLTSATFLWADLGNRYVWFCLFSVLWLGGLGFADDALKLLRKNSKGLKGSVKLLGQILLGLGIGAFLYKDSPSWQAVSLPFLKNWFWSMGIFYILFVALVITGSSNAVNLTDGLDGLAVGCTIILALAYGILGYVVGHARFSGYLQIPFVPGAGELAVFCAAVVGAGMGFLWFNAYPASIFMGDTGSLSLGGALGVVAVFIKKEILLVFVGGIFVVEALSVILQVASFRLTKKRIFLMAPIHHHFQLLGVEESKVVIRFWIVALMLALLGIVTLKLQ